MSNIRYIFPKVGFGDEFCRSQIIEFPCWKQERTSFERSPDRYSGSWLISLCFRHDELIRDSYDKMSEWLDVCDSRLLFRASEEDCTGCVCEVMPNGSMITEDLFICFPMRQIGCPHQVCYRMIGDKACIYVYKPSKSRKKE